MICILKEGRQKERTLCKGANNWASRKERGVRARKTRRFRERGTQGARQNKYRDGGRKTDKGRVEEKRKRGREERNWSQKETKEKENEN